MSTTQNVTFKGSSGQTLAARLELPKSSIRAYALFAHCFTCSKDILAAKRIASSLAGHGIAVLRFDFTGLGGSEGDFAETNFSSNMEDLKQAADFLRSTYQAPEILIGHSLGGSAILAVASDIPEAKAVVTLGAPSDPAHVTHQFGKSLSNIEQDGESEVSLAGRPFTIKKQFVDDLQSIDLIGKVSSIKKAILVMHAPFDQTVSIDNASALFAAAKHPKSFVSLDNADHLLSRNEDSQYAADMISAWVSRFVGNTEKDAQSTKNSEIIATETGFGKFQNHILVGDHMLLADEPTDVGGLDTGPAPYDLLCASLAACTSMTLRMYVDFKKITIGKISVSVSHEKHEESKVDQFNRTVTVEGLSDPKLEEKLISIANKCPVHKTLERGAEVNTKIKSNA